MTSILTMNTAGDCNEVLNAIVEFEKVFCFLFNSLTDNKLLNGVI